MTKEKTLAIEEFQKFLEYLPKIEGFTSNLGKPSPLSILDFSILYKLMFYCALRLGEVKKLKKSDFSLDEKILKVHTSKTTKIQNTSIPSTILGDLRSFLKNKKDDETIFPVTRQIILKYAQETVELAGIEISDITEKRESENLGSLVFRESYEKFLYEKKLEKGLVDLKLRNISLNRYGNYKIKNLLYAEDEIFKTMFSYDKIPNDVNDWNYDLILELVKKEFFETDIFDFKENLPKNLEHAACAFANTNGGFLIFGIKDENGLAISERILGIEKNYELPRLLGDKIESASPHIQYAFRNPAIQIPDTNKVIHVIHIPKSKDGPHMSSDSIFRYRTNKGNQRMTREQVRDAFLDENTTLARKSAHYRYAVHEQILGFIESIPMRLHPNYEKLNIDLMRDENKMKSLQIIKKYMDKDEEDLYNMFVSISMGNFMKFNTEYKYFIEDFNTLDRFPHSDLFSDEQDALILLEEQIRFCGEDIFDFQESFKYKDVKNIHGSFEEMSNSSNDPRFFKRLLLRYIRYLKDFVFALIEMMRIYNEIHKKYGKTAFKSYL